MPRTIEQVDAFLRDPANKNRHQGDGWHNRCEQFVNNAGGFSQTFPTALAAAKASGPLNPDKSTMPHGAIGYWRGVWLWGSIAKRFIECGHTAFWNGRWAMASDAVTDMIGNGTGTIADADYERLRPAAIWWGWTLRHGIETLAPTPRPVIPKPAPAAVIIKPLTPKEEDPMAHPISFVKGDSPIPGYSDAVFRIDNLRCTRRYLPYNGVLLGLPGGIGEVKVISQGALDLIPWDDGPTGKAHAEWAAVEAKINAHK